MKHPRVALVEASSTSTHVYSRTYLPRVGIPTLGALLKGLGYECDLWFQAMSPVSEEQLRQYDIVGIGSLTNTIPEAYRLADSCKRTGNTVVMGGPHVTFMPEEALGHCDYVVIGEGDVTFPALVAALATGESRCLSRVWRAASLAAKCITRDRPTQLTSRISPHRTSRYRHRWSLTGSRRSS